MQDYYEVNNVIKKLTKLDLATENPRILSLLDKIYKLFFLLPFVSYQDQINVLIAHILDEHLFNKFFVVACMQGNIDLIGLLIKRENIDVAAYNNSAIYFAALKGHDQAIGLLLKDPRVDPAASYNSAISKASFNGHTAVVSILLKEGRAKPQALDNFALRNAAANGHAAVVRLLLNDTRVDPTAKKNEALRAAFKKIGLAKNLQEKNSYIIIALLLAPFFVVDERSLDILSPKINALKANYKKVIHDRYCFFQKPVVNSYSLMLNLDIQKVISDISIELVKKEVEELATEILKIDHESTYTLAYYK